MTRLPTPGQDSGQWGTILNDFLSQTHTSTGALKPGVVSSDNIANNTIATENIKDGAITSGKLAINTVTPATIGASPAITDHNASTTPAAKALTVDGNGTLRVGDGTTQGGVVAGSGVFVTTVALPAASGGDDTVAINTVLASAAGKYVHGTAGARYLISGPLVISSGTILDMTGCAITLADGSACNMLVNSAVGRVLRILDAVTVAGSTVVSSASGLFTESMTGSSITIQGAGASGGLLTATFTFASATEGLLSNAAGTSVTGQYAAIGGRDSRITVIGGYWDRQDEGGVPANSVMAHTMRFRHVDGLDVNGCEYHATGGKYAVNPGDCTRVLIDKIKVTSTSDGVHFNGPCSGVTVRDIRGSENMGDDLVSFTARDSTAVITDCAGDIVDALVDGVYFPSSNQSLYASALKIVAGRTTDESADYAVRRLTARNLTCTNTTAAVVYVGDSSGGVIDEILIDGVRSLGGSSRGVVDLKGGAQGAITLRNLTAAAGDSYVVSVNTDVDRLTVSSAAVSATALSPNVISVYSGTVTSLVADGCSITAPSGAVLRVNSGGTVARAMLSNVRQSGGAQMMSVPAGGVLASIDVHGLTSVDADYPLGVYQGATDLSVANVDATGATALVWASGSGIVTISGATGVSSNSNSVLGVVDIAPETSILTASPESIAVGAESMPRLLAQGSPQLSTGRMILTYFTARTTGAVNSVSTYTAGTATTGPTLCRVGIYEVAANGDLALVASVVNDATMWGAAWAGNMRTLTTAWSRIAGRRYAFAALFVGTVGPKLIGAAPCNGSVLAVNPRLAGNVDSLSDLPAAVSAAAVLPTQGIMTYAYLSQ